MQCVIIDCDSDSNKHPDLLFFEFPNRSTHSFMVWNTICFESQFVILRHRFPRICEKHFKAKDIKNGNLKVNALPELNLNMSVQDNIVAAQERKSHLIKLVNDTVLEWSFQNGSLYDMPASELLTVGEKVRDKLGLRFQLSIDNFWLRKFRKSNPCKPPLQFPTKLELDEIIRRLDPNVKIWSDKENEELEKIMCIDDPNSFYVLKKREKPAQPAAYHSKRYSKEPSMCESSKRLKSDISKALELELSINKTEENCYGHKIRVERMERNSNEETMESKSDDSSFPKNRECDEYDQRTERSNKTVEKDKSVILCLNENHFIKDIEQTKQSSTKTTNEYKLDLSLIEKHVGEEIFGMPPVGQHECNTNTTITIRQESKSEELINYQSNTADAESCSKKMFIPKVIISTDQALSYLIPLESYTLKLRNQKGMLLMSNLRKALEEH